MPIPIRRRRTRILLENPTTTADGDGGFTQSWAALTPPRLWVELRPALSRELERTAAGGTAVQSVGVYVVTGQYHSGVTTKTRLRVGSRVFQVTGAANVDEVGTEMVLTCVETVG